MSEAVQSVQSLGYLVLGCRDVAAWGAFARDILGMQVAWEHPGQEIGLRMDERHYRVVLRQSDDDEIQVLGWELHQEDGLAALVAQLHAQGHPVQESTTDEREERSVAALWRCADPVTRWTHEFAVGPLVQPVSRPFHSPVLKSGFRTGDLGVGHVAMTSPHYDRSFDFYHRGLGLKVSGYGKGQIAPGVPLVGAFLHAASGRHHSLAVLQAPHPKPTRHIMFEYQDMDDVGMALDRCLQAGVPIDRSLGVHEGDRMFSFYAVAPSGLPIEIGWGGLVSPEWKPATLSALSEWGHQKLPR